MLWVAELNARLDYALPGYNPSMIKSFKILNISTQAKLACAYSGVAWGLYWIPLRLMDQAGIYAAWSTVLFYAVPLSGRFFPSLSSSRLCCLFPVFIRHSGVRHI